MSGHLHTCLVTRHGGRGAPPARGRPQLGNRPRCGRLPWPAGGLPCRIGASDARLLPHLERLDDVVDLDVVVADADTALVALADLGRVLLEAAQRRDGEVVGDDDTAADEPRLAVADDDARTDQR